MSFTPKEILSFVEENDVKFIRLTFCDMFGNLKNVAIMPNELPKAFEYGVPFDASCLHEGCSDLLLVPDIATLSVLPWRPKSGRVVRFFCSLKNLDGSDYSGDMRTRLTEYINTLRLDGYSCEMGTKCEFYLFELDEMGRPTKTPHDSGSYLDVAPLDRCENARREICLSLEEMGMNPKSSCHKHGPAQNEIDFRESEPVTAADNMVHYKTVVKSIAAQNGLFASFMPMPLPDEHGSALSISVSLKKGGDYIFPALGEEMPFEGKCFINGVLSRVCDITAFLNCTTNSYKRFGQGYAPMSVNWSYENRSQLIRVPGAAGTSPRIEIRSADASCNPYIAFRLILAAGIEGIEKGDTSLYEKTKDVRDSGIRLPYSLIDAIKLARSSDFVQKHIDPEVSSTIFGRLEGNWYEYSTKHSEAERTAFEDSTYFRYV